jgi:hypothetical protein
MSKAAPCNRQTYSLIKYQQIISKTPKTPNFDIFVPTCFKYVNAGIIRLSARLNRVSFFFIANFSRPEKVNWYKIIFYIFIFTKLSIF